MQVRTNALGQNAGLVLYYAAFAIYVFAATFAQININFKFILDKTQFCFALQTLSLAFIVLKIALDRYNLSQYFGIAAIICVGVYSYYLTKERYLLDIAVFACGARGVSIRKLAMLVLVIVGPMLAITVLLASIGVIQSDMMIRRAAAEISKESSATAERMALGFSHPNRVGQYTLELVISLFILFVEKRRLLVVTACALAFAFIKATADSRTALAAFVLIAIVSLLYGILSNHPRLFGVFVVCSIIGSIVLSLVLLIGFDSNIQLFRMLDSLLSNRAILMNASYKVSGITLFGFDFSSAPVVGHTLSGGENRYMLDNAYAHLLLLYGVVGFSIVVISMLQTTIYAFIARETRVELLALAMMVLFGVTETYAIYVDCNVCLVMIFGWLLQDYRLRRKRQCGTAIMWV